jgi:hypothetical protein
VNVLRTAGLAALLLACRQPTKAPPQKAADPPVSSPDSIPDAPVSGTIHGEPFVARDMRYVVDDRIGYEHVDIELSTGKSDGVCGAIKPERPTSVWLRLDGKHVDGSAEGGTSQPIKIDPRDTKSWSVHYQVFLPDVSGGHWQGITAKKSLLVLRGPSPDGHLSGGVAVCFGDEQNSCVSGSFDAKSCPPRIDQPVRGTPPPEAIPKEFLERMQADGGAH